MKHAVLRRLKRLTSQGNGFRATLLKLELAFYRDMERRIRKSADLPYTGIDAGSAAPSPSPTAYAFALLKGKPYSCACAISKQA